jgi:hypothetical protein
MDQTTSWLRLRLTNLIAALTPSKVIPGWVAGDDELRDVGRLTLMFARVEETIALYCEVLLLRPELRGFHSAKPTVEKTLTEKLDLYRRLIIATGCLHSVGTDEIEQTVARMREVGERRNTVIHGHLYSDDNGQVVFRNRGKEIRADSATLRPLTSDLMELRVRYAEAFRAFYCRLPRCGPPYPRDAEEKVLSALVTQLELYRADLKVHRSTTVLEQSRAELAQSKKTVHNSKRRARRALERKLAAVSRLPLEYQDLLRSWLRQLRRCTTARPVAKRQAELAKLEAMTAEIRAYEERENVTVSDSMRQAMAAEVEALPKSR